ncbi:Kae1-associated serine/threonine protein kinase [Candidatus Bathyarchaeota archaeon]|nr:Kae1-associated serine/threonine protein kinase [Candidatus Bathyarchaeota archaeon]
MISLGESELKLIKKGAEANLYLAKWHGKEVVIKKRIQKRYRVKALDEKLRFYRTIHEAQIMHEAKKAEVATPTIFFVDELEAAIVMEYIKGDRVKELLDFLTPKRREVLCMKIGVFIGKLHKKGIIHGDLTTSNMIVVEGEKIFFIDFGLSFYSFEDEDRGSDLLLMKRALSSTHFKFFNKCFKKVVEGYIKEVGVKEALKTLAKVNEIEKRGRYVERGKP